MSSSSPAAGASSAGSTPIRRDVVVIGGGQAGLAIGCFLARQGIDFVILDAGAEVGSAWRERWDSLRLFTPAGYSGLPGLPFPGEPDHYPGRDEVAAYLTEYARQLELPIALDSRVREVRKLDDTYLIELAGRDYEAAQASDAARSATYADWMPVWGR